MKLFKLLLSILSVSTLFLLAPVEAGQDFFRNVPQEGDCQNHCPIPTNLSIGTYQLSPLFVVDFERKNRAINQSLQEDFQSITFKDQSKGFIVEKISKQFIGVGFNTSVFFGEVLNSIGTLSYNIGIVPIKGKEIFKSFYVKNENEIQGTKRGIPHKIADLKEWNIGDYIQYNSTGGILFSNSVQAISLSVGAILSTFGTYKVYVEKTAKNKAVVSLIQDKLWDASVYIGSSFASLSSHLIKQNGNGWTFEFHVNNKNAAISYERLMTGNILFAENLAKEQATGIKKIDTYKYLYRGRIKKLFFGIPYLNKSNTKARLYNYENFQNHRNGMTTISQYGISLALKNKTIIKKYKSYSKSFYGGIAKTYDKNKKLVSSDHHAKFFWRWENSNANSYSLERAIDKLSKVIGHRHSKYLFEPKQKKESLKYTQVDFQYLVKGKFIASLLDNNGRNPHFNYLKSETYSNIEEYFSKDSDVLKICKKWSFKKCKKQFLKWADFDFNNILRLLETMNENIGDESKKFVNTFRNLGNIIFNNTFIFKTFFQTSKNCGSHFQYEVSGRKISKYILNRKYDYDESKCFNGGL